MRREYVLCMEGKKNVLRSLSDIIKRQESTSVMHIEVRACCINCIIKTCGGHQYMNMHYKQVLMIPEQQVTDTNPLFDLAIVPRELQTTPLHSSTQLDPLRTHTSG